MSERTSGVNDYWVPAFAGTTTGNASPISHLREDERKCFVM
jgi:hypothetical protein